MLDPPNKKNVLKICKSPPTTMEAASYLSQSRSTFEDKNVMFDYSTREAYNLEAVNVNASNYASFAQPQSPPDPHYYYEHYGQQESAPINNTYITSIADSFNTIFSPMPSTSRLSHQHHSLETHQEHVNPANYSLTKLQTKHERMEADNNQAFSYTPSNPMLPSLLHHDYPHSSKYHMERYDYLQYQENLAARSEDPNASFLDPLDVPPQEASVLDNMVNNSIDDSIQINEISSSFTEKNAEMIETKEETIKGNSKKQRTAAPAIKKRIFYETRLTNRKLRACSKSISKKVTLKKKHLKKKIKATSIATKIPEKNVCSPENDKRKPRNIAKNKENNEQNSKETIAPTRMLRNAKPSAIAVKLLKPDKQILKQSQPVQRSITLRSTNVQGTPEPIVNIVSKRKRSLANMVQDSSRNSKLRKIK